jgi:AcrR family transcriptional regulator
LRPKPEKKEEKEKIRLALLSATLRLAAAHGFASVALREVSREAGIAPTSFYRHFADMEEVGRVLVEDLVSGVVDGCLERLKGAKGEGLEVGALVVDELFQALESDPALVRFMVSERVGAFAPIRAALREKLARLTVALREALERTRPKGKPSLPVEVAELASTLLVEACAEALDATEPDARVAVRQHVLRRLALLTSYTAPAGGAS